MSIAFSGALTSWVVWGVWIIVGVSWELWTVYTEKKWGFLPLTRIIRDRLMRRSTLAKIGGLAFLTWLWVHFVLPLPW